MMDVKEMIDTHNNYAIETVMMGPGDRSGFYMERAIELCCICNEMFEDQGTCVDRLTCCVHHKKDIDYNPNELLEDGKPRYMTFCWA